MPIDTCFSLLGKAKDVICWIIDRLDKLGLSENVVRRIKENLEYMQIKIKQIKPYIKRDSDSIEIKQFFTHLENAQKLCAGIKDQHILDKFLQAPSDLTELHNIEAEVKNGYSKLLLFIASNHFTSFCDTADFQNKKLDALVALQEGTRAGINIIADRSVRPPPAPPGFKIQPNKNKFLLSWKPCGGTVDDYEVCYDEAKKFTFLTKGPCLHVEIDSSRVAPGKMYAMKVRGINKGGNGEWSDTVYGQLTKPCPQKPEISYLFLRSTMAVVTVKIPDKNCDTESPVTCVEVLCVNEGGTKFHSEFEIEPGKDTYTFTIKELQPESKYYFRIKTRNAEGWSEPSNFREDKTLTLPSKPCKPTPPIIKLCTPTEVNLEVKVPNKACNNEWPWIAFHCTKNNEDRYRAPIVQWKVLGYTADNEEIHIIYTLDETYFLKESILLNMQDLNPDQEYTLQVLAKNENGWSEPSEKFTIHIAKPSTPKYFRVSSKRSHSLIKIRWDAPDSFFITHYEVIKRKKKGDYDEEPFEVPANKFSVTFTNLKHNTHYCFSIRTCNGSHVSDWNQEIETNTRIHKAIKAAFSPAVWTLGTVTSPFMAPFMAIGGGVVAGMVGNEESGKVAAVAAGTAGTVGGLALGTVGAPLLGAAYAHAFVHGVDGLSDQSDDEDAVIIKC